MKTILAGAVLCGAITMLAPVPAAHATPIAPLTVGVTADLGVLTDVQWGRRCWRDRWGRLHCRGGGWGRRCWWDSWGRRHCRWRSDAEVSAEVRFGSKVDMCGASTHIRFTPHSDRKSGRPHKAMSAIPP